MGEPIARKVLELDPGSATGYVLLTNIYAAGSKWNLSVKVQQQRLEKAVKRQPWVNRIEVNNKVHVFEVDDH
jgi:PIN domain nuclease of toxin-antitoxin system